MGKLAIHALARGDGWSVGDAICNAGPRDRPFEERHRSVRIAVVVEGSFRYRSGSGSEVMSPGSLLLGSYGQSFECGHEDGTGDRCIAFEYSPEFFEQVGAPGTFPALRIPPLAGLAPWVVEARRGGRAPAAVVFEELAHGLVGAVLGVLGSSRSADRAPSPADERRISTVLRFIDAGLDEPLPLRRLALIARMSEFHFLRVFKQVAGVTPHQYVLRARLREAAFRLKTRTDPVLEIALDAGFGDLSHFHHAFQAEFGVSPAQFRGKASRGR